MLFNIWLVAERNHTQCCSGEEGAQVVGGQHAPMRNGGKVHLMVVALAVISLCTP